MHHKGKIAWEDPFCLEICCKIGLACLFRKSFILDIFQIPGTRDSLSDFDKEHENTFAGMYVFRL